MDSFELNKIIGAILGTLLFVMGVGFITEAIYEPIEGRGPGYTLPEPEGSHGGETVEKVEVPIGLLLASADVAQGQSAARKCQGCHNFGEGEPNKQGPGLYDVVGRLIGSHEGFTYSEVMKSHHDAGDAWTYENLNHFLTAPGAFMPKTKMNFGGLKNDAERANVIAYLSTLSKTPVPFPAPEAAPGGDVATSGGEPTTPVEVIPTPTVTSGDTPVEGTPTTSGTEGAPAAPGTETPATPAAPATETPATPAAPATETPATPTTTETPATPATPTTTETPATPAAPAVTTTTSQ